MLSETGSQNGMKICEVLDTKLRWLPSAKNSHFLPTLGEANIEGAVISAGSPPTSVLIKAKKKVHMIICEWRTHVFINMVSCFIKLLIHRKGGVPQAGLRII